MSADTIDTISKRFCPLFYLHPNEPFPPCSLPELMRHCDFEYDGTLPATLSPNMTPPPVYKISNSVLSQADTNEKLLELLGKFTGLSFASYPTRRLTIVNKDMPPNSVEVQAIFSDPFVFMRKTYFTITYLLFYPYNGTLEPHLFDQEYATVLFKCESYKFTNNNTSLEITNPQIFRIYLSSHGKGKWFNKDEFVYSDEIRPNIYVAVESHSMFPKPMIVRKFFGFGNDETADGGIVYDPIDKVVVLAEPTSILNKVYYQLNKLYYYNGLYQDQSSVLFIERRTNFLFYDGYYKTTSTAELWEIPQFKKFKGLFYTFFYVCILLVFIIILDHNNICTLLSYLCILVFSVICTFMATWFYFS